MEIALYIIMAIIAITLLVLMFIYKRTTLTTWVLEAVVIAEKEIGSGKGQEKLELVHKRLKEKFPVIGRILPFGLFSKMVDSALDLIKSILEEVKAEQEKKGEE